MNVRRTQQTHDGPRLYQRLKSRYIVTSFEVQPREDHQSLLGEFQSSVQKWETSEGSLSVKFLSDPAILTFVVV